MDIEGMAMSKQWQCRFPTSNKAIQQLDDKDVYNVSTEPLFGAVITPDASVLLLGYIRHRLEEIHYKTQLELIWNSNPSKLTNRISIIHPHLNAHNRQWNP